MASLKEKFNNTPIREDSGANTASRYRFQALCGLVLVLERHELDGDYALVFEYHDDIAMLDGSVDPKHVSFYQVKSKNAGHWTRTALTVRKKSAKKGSSKLLPSILGKMYQNLVSFGRDVNSATFLSNAPTNFAPAKDNFCLNECDKKDLENIVSKLKAEFPNETIIRTDTLRVDRTNLSLNDADLHARGKLDAFVVKRLGEVEFSTAVIFRAVSDECVRKAGAKTNTSEFDVIVKDRGITRRDTDGWLATVREVVDCPKWEMIAPKLNFPILEEMSIAREWRAYRVGVLNPNEAVRRVRREIIRALELPDCQSMGLSELITYVCDVVRGVARSELAPISEARIKAMILYETYSKN